MSFGRRLARRRLDHAITPRQRLWPPHQRSGPSGFGDLVLHRLQLTDEGIDLPAVTGGDSAHVTA
jgi:hypothetical protein